MDALLPPRQYVLFVVLPQLDAFAGEGVARVLSGFATIEKDAEAYAEQTFASYEHDESDAASFAEEAQKQGVEYYRTLAELRQAFINLLATGLYHLYEQHRVHVERLLADEGKQLVEPLTPAVMAKLRELRLIANTAKHANGPSAQELHALRPDLFIPPVLPGTLSGPDMAAAPITVTNSLGGTDFFVSQADLEGYRDAIREYWDAVSSQL